MRILLIVILGTVCLSVYAQPVVKGRVLEEQEDGTRIPLEFVNVYWMGSNLGTSTDSSGYFQIENPSKQKNLVFSYVGMQSDTIEIVKNRFVTVLLQTSNMLEEVEIRYRRKSVEISFIDPFLVQSVSEDELFKAACCNLSESFETNPSIDVSFADAITGAKEIKMLGLAGKYSLISQEFMPGIRGLAIPFGLLYIPGTWIESIQLTKGSGSVVNGYESMAGQINVELQKPEESDRLYVNLFTNQAKRLEANVNTAIPISKNLSTAILAHGSWFTERHDKNSDGFIDVPEGSFLSFINRWKLKTDKGIVGQFGVKYLRDDKVGGQMDYQEGEPSTDLYGVTRMTNRYELWGKTGFIFRDKPYQSVGFQWSHIHHEQDGTFGLRTYAGEQSSWFANLMFQSILGSTFHQYKLGLTLQSDNYSESFLGLAPKSEERIAGAFFEYTFLPSDQFTLVAGFRADHHNLFDWLLTPRLHLRFAPTETTVIRASAGKGYRTPHAMVENLSLLATSRTIFFPNTEDGLLGLDREASWNFGLSATQNFTLDYRDGYISLDFFKTIFQNQAVLDLDDHPQGALIFNLEGVSYANSFQAEVSYELLKRMDIKMAYRFYDVETSYRQGRMQQPLLAKNRAFLNLAYETRKTLQGGSWMFDYTVQWTGSSRLPLTEGNPAEYRLGLHSPDFITMNAQVTKKFSDKFQLYAGGENLTDFRQDNAILAANDPFGPYFDSSMIWGPIFGRKIYMGLRFRLGGN